LTSGSLNLNDALEALSNVFLPNPADGEVLTFQASTKLWIAGAGGGGGEANTHSSLGGGTFALTAAVPKTGVNLNLISVSNGDGMNASLAADILTLAVATTVVQTDQTNVYADFNQDFRNGKLRIANPANTFHYDFTSAAIVANRSLLLPLLSANDTLAVLGIAQTFTGKITMSGADIDLGGSNLDNIQNLIHDISTSGVDIDFDEDELQTISISANTTFTTANRVAGRSKSLKIITDGTLRTLTFPAWDWVSDIPANQAASKNGYLTLTSYGTTDALIVAAYQVGSL